MDEKRIMKNEDYEFNTISLVNEVNDVVDADNFIEKDNNTITFQKNKSSPKIRFKGNLDIIILSNANDGLQLDIINPDNASNCYGFSEVEVNYMFDTSSRRKIIGTIASIILGINNEKKESQISKRIKEISNLFKKGVDK